jgi:hypothetical protein
MGTLLAMLWRAITAAAAAVGAAIVARTYTEAPTAEERALAGDGRRQQAAEAPRPEAQRHPIRPGWSRPKPETIPSPTYWPALLAFGLVFLLWGLISNIFVLIFGAIVFAVAAAGWVYDLIEEFSHE